MGIEGRHEELDPARLLDLSGALCRVAEALSSTAAARSEQQAGERQTNGEPTAEAVRNVIRARRVRDGIFPDRLFADPAWDMLLDLYAAHLEERQVSVSSLCLAAAVPATTALRWIDNLEGEGLLLRRADPSDARRVHLALSPDCAERMARVFRSTMMSAMAPI